MFKPHSTEKIADHDMHVGDDRFYNNVFVGNGGESLYIIEDTNEGVPFYFSYGLQCYEFRPQLPETGGNVYYYGAMPSKNEKGQIIELDPGITIREEGENVFLEFSVSPEHIKTETQIVTGDFLGRAKVPDAPFEDHDGSALVIDTDYFGEKRDPENPSPGPFENTDPGKNVFRVWPLTNLDE